MDTSKTNAEEEIWKFDAAMQVQINDTPKQAAMEGQWNEMRESQGSLNINSLKGRINAGRKRGAV